MVYTPELAFLSLDRMSAQSLGLLHALKWIKELDYTGWFHLVDLAKNQGWGFNTLNMRMIQMYFKFTRAMTCVIRQDTLSWLLHLVLSHLGLAFVLMLRPFSPELVMFSDFEFWTSLGTSIFAYFAVAEGWLLLDIGWVVLFLTTQL